MGDISVGVPRRGLVERLVNLKGLWNQIIGTPTNKQSNIITALEHYLLMNVS